MTDKEIFDQVLTIGPDIEDQGGMASVLQLYRRELPAFHYLRSNSRHGTVAGLFPLIALMCRLPFARLKGRRILHVHTADGKSFIRKSWIMVWGRLWGYKIIYHCHAGGTKAYFEARGIDRVKAILNKCEASIVLSESWRKYFAETIGLKHIHVLNNIVEPAPSGNGRRITDKPLRLLFMGTLTDNKGIFDLVDAIGRNAGTFRGNMTLAIAGSGDELRLQRKIDEYGIADMISIIGWITGDRKEQAFTDADIAILPSYYEGSPIFLLEAMAHSMPVISTNVGGIPDIVDSSNGILTAPGDLDAIAQAIAHYINTPQDVATHGHRSIEKVSAFFPVAVVKKLTEIYRSVL